MMVRFLKKALVAAAIIATLGTTTADAGPLRRLICRGPGGCGVEAPSCGSGGPIRRLFPRFDRSPGCGCESSAAIDLPAGITSVAQGLESVTESRPSAASGGIAQAKAEVQARLGVMHHPGGSFGAGSREGVGFSSASADEAIRQCCYWGQCQPIDIGVARGANGWFACVIYR